MEIYTIGFTKRSAAEFFGLLGDHRIARLLDIRLHNTSQLAGYTKRDDLEFFLDGLLSAEYRHDLTLAPTEDLLSGYRKHAYSWQEYETRFRELIAERKIELTFPPAYFALRTVLLCSELKPQKCHRRLVAEYLAQKGKDLEIVHL